MDKDTFDDMSKPAHSSKEFLNPFIAAIIGGYIGHKLDNTRFGHWFNNSPIIEFVLDIFKILFIIGTLVLGIWYVVLLFTNPVRG